VPKAQSLPDFSGENQCVPLPGSALGWPTACSGAVSFFRAFYKSRSRSRYRLAGRIRLLVYQQLRVWIRPRAPSGAPRSAHVGQHLRDGLVDVIGFGPNAPTATVDRFVDDIQRMSTSRYAWTSRWNALPGEAGTACPVRGGEPDGLTGPMSRSSSCCYATRACDRRTASVRAPGTSRR